MFTGIIEELGRVREAREGMLVIEAAVALEGTRLGDSIAVNGCDLTVAVMSDGAFQANAMPETYRRTNLGDLRPGDEVNLERALTLSKPLGGHLVRGVVEATGTLETLAPEGDAFIARYRAPAEILGFVIVKGPVCVDGASLTVIDRTDETFAVSLVGHTQQHTNLLKRRPGDRVNLETDIIARYVGRLLDERSKEG